MDWASVPRIGAPLPWREGAPVSLLHRVEIGRAAAVIPVAWVPAQIAVLLQILQRPLDGAS